MEAVVEGQDRPVAVLVDPEALAGKTVFTEQINAALSAHRQLIEQLANSLHKPGDERDFVEADQLAPLQLSLLLERYQRVLR